MTITLADGASYSVRYAAPETMLRVYFVTEVIGLTIAEAAAVFSDASKTTVITRHEDDQDTRYEGYTVLDNLRQEIDGITVFLRKGEQT